MAKKVVVLLAEGFEEVEALTPVDVLRRAGIETEMLSITGNKEVTGARQIKVVADGLFTMEKTQGTDLLLLPGGMPGASNIDRFDMIDAVLEEFCRSDRYIAAICAAPMILGKRGYLKNISAVCYPGYENDLDGCRPSNKAVEHDGRFITSKGVGAAMEFALKLVEVLDCKDTADDLAQKMVVY